VSVRDPLVFGTVGTDHHRFDRFVGWMDEWARRTHRPARCFVQHGTSMAPRVARGRDYLPYPEMAALLRRATAVVCHGGPATIMAARAAGLRPIVVPRRPELDEHVDGHQVAFSERIAATGEVALASTPAELDRLLADVLDDPSGWRVRGAGAQLDAVQRFDLLVDELLRARPPRTRRVGRPVPLAGSTGR
jgi:UDP-N-acetylglucosamine transferase subunit ALG13